MLGKLKLDCEVCGEEVRSKRFLKVIKKKRFCKKCYRDNRHQHREETIIQSGIKEDLKRLDNRRDREFAKKKRRRIKSAKIKEIPKIKNSRVDKKKQKSSAYLTLNDKQDLFRLLVGRGIGAEEAKERIKNLIAAQKEVRGNMKEENITEESIRTKQQELLEELWNN